MIYVINCSNILCHKTIDWTQILKIQRNDLFVTNENTSLFITHNTTFNFVLFVANEIMLFSLNIMFACSMRHVFVTWSHVRNSHRGVLHADREDRPL